MYKVNDDFHPERTVYPKHVAIIPDGGRRWAVEHNTSYYESYVKMTERGLDIIKMLFEDEVEIISIYFSSTHNFARPQNEVESFCKAEAAFLNSLILVLAKEMSIKITVIGKRNGLPSYLVSAIEKAEKETKLYTNKKLYICINYNALDEIQEAVLTAKTNESDSFVNYLQIPHPVNLLIRTGDAKVLSNFLLAQMSFARLFFFQKLFNDLSHADIKHILNEYEKYQIKYGE